MYVCMQKNRPYRTKTRRYYNTYLHSSTALCCPRFFTSLLSPTGWPTQTPNSKPRLKAQDPNPRKVKTPTATAPHTNRKRKNPTPTLNPQPQPQPQHVNKHPNKQKPITPPSLSPLLYVTALSHPPSRQAPPTTTHSLRPPARAHVRILGTLFPIQPLAAAAAAGIPELNRAEAKVNVFSLLTASDRNDLWKKQGGGGIVWRYVCAPYSCFFLLSIDHSFLSLYMYTCM
ncbi:hypothetical protein DFP73DRAFT_560775 [Morchella snyderi]|nr:hypothetical protein DFP73DRAFT_560775 [Morchella snyderi]